MTSQFDAATFLDATIAEPSVKRPPLTAGADFVGIIGEPKSRNWQGKVDPSKSGVAIDIPVEIDLTSRPEEPAAKGGVTKVTLSDSIMLDLTPQGAIDNAPGKNGKLRRYREALDMNKPGDQFSFRAMQGRMIRVKIKHDPYEGEIYDKIDNVAKA